MLVVHPKFKKSCAIEICIFSNNTIRLLKISLLLPIQLSLSNFAVSKVVLLLNAITFCEIITIFGRMITIELAIKKTVTKIGSRED